MGRPATNITLTVEEKRQLEAMVRALKTERRYADRARIVLKAASGASGAEIAKALEVREASVSKWRVRFEREGLEGLCDDYRPGRRACASESSGPLDWILRKATPVGTGGGGLLPEEAPRRVRALP